MSTGPALPLEDPLVTLLTTELEAGSYTCAVAVVGDHRETERTVAVGQSDPAASVDASADTRFDAASLTKPVVTTTVALRLVEEGVLALTDELGTHVPALEGTDRGAATVRQLLTHTAGFQPYHFDGWTSRTAAESAILEAPVLAREPGTAHEYSCLSYVHLVAVLRRVTGQSLADLARRLVFEPAGMTDARLGPLEDPPADTAVTYDHEHGEGRLKGAIHDPIARAMAGESGNAGLFLTATDLARFARSLLAADEADGVPPLEPDDGDAGPPLAPTTVDALHRDHNPEMDEPHSLGWRVAHDGWPAFNWSDRPDRTPAIGHTGYTGTSLWLDRRRDQFAALLTNEVHEGKDGDMARVREQFHAITAAGRY